MTRFGAGAGATSALTKPSVTKGQTVRVFPSDALAAYWAAQHGLSLSGERAWGLPLVRAGRFLRSAGRSDFPAVFGSAQAGPPDLRSLPRGVAGVVLHDVSDEHGFLDRVREHAPEARVYARYACPVAEWGADPEDHVRRTLSKSRRKKLRRDLREAEALGPVTLGWVDRSQAGEQFDEFFRLVCERAAASGLYDSAVRRYGYLRGLWETFAGEELLVSVLRVAGRTVSFRSGFVVGDRFVGHLPAFDRRLARLGPGHLHLHLLLPELHDRGVRAYDFGKGARSSKEVWASRSHTLSTVLVPGGDQAAAVAARMLVGGGERLRSTVTARGWAEPLRRVLHWGLTRRDGEYRRSLRRWGA